MQTNVIIASDSVNGNGRKYSAEALSRAVQSYNETGHKYGWFDRPSDTLTPRLSETAIKVNNIWLEGDKIVGSVDLLDTPNGKLVQDFIDKGQNFKLGVRMLCQGNELDKSVIDRVTLVDVGLVPVFTPFDDNEVTDFICGMRNDGTMHAFLEGYCYWFAHILYSRFLPYVKTYIMYNQILGHFATSINGKLYDITGRIEDDGNWVEWEQWKKDEPCYSKVVERDCILKKQEGPRKWTDVRDIEIDDRPYLSPIAHEEKRELFDGYDNIDEWAEHELSFMTDDEIEELKKTCEECKCNFEDSKTLVNEVKQGKGI